MVGLIPLPLGRNFSQLKNSLTTLYYLINIKRKTKIYQKNLM